MKELKLLCPWRSYAPKWNADKSGRKLILYCLLDKSERPFTLKEILRQIAVKFLLDAGVDRQDISLDALQFIEGETVQADLLVKKDGYIRLVAGFARNPKQNITDKLVAKAIKHAEAATWKEDFDESSKIRRAPEVWVSNGFAHRFYRFKNGWEWQETEELAYPCPLFMPSP